MGDSKEPKVVKLKESKKSKPAKGKKPLLPKTPETDPPDEPERDIKQELLDIRLDRCSVVLMKKRMVADLVYDEMLKTGVFYKTMVNGKTSTYYFHTATKSMYQIGGKK